MRCSVIVGSLVLSAVVAVATAEEGEHWTYEGGEGPEYWGELAEDFRLCAEGRNQSPIDLAAELDADLPELVFEYVNLYIPQEINTGHAIQLIVAPGNFVSSRRRPYELKQFHFHSPSEHLIEGTAFPMEVHLVHQDDAGNYLVVGLLFQEGERNELMDELPSFRSARGLGPPDKPFDYNALVRGRSEYFIYNGSLTTPPCTEGVQWLIMKQPIIVAPEQIQHYHDLLGFDNNRPVQPQNARIILD